MVGVRHPLTVDWAHPMARGLFAGTVLIGHQTDVPTDLYGRRAATIGSPSWSWRDDGLVLSSGGFEWASVNQQLSTLTDVTHLVFGHSFSVTGNYARIWGGHKESDGNYGSALLTYSTASTLTSAHQIADSPAQYGWDSAIGFPTGPMPAVFGTIFTGTQQRTYSRRQTAVQTITGQSPDMGVATTTRWAMGRHAITGGELRGVYGWCLSWNRALTVPELTAIEDDPYLFLRPQVQRRWFDLSVNNVVVEVRATLGGSGTSGTEPSITGVVTGRASGDLRSAVTHQLQSGACTALGGLIGTAESRARQVYNLMSRNHTRSALTDLFRITTSGVLSRTTVGPSTPSVHLV